jgi:hypothetical protein
VGLDMKIIFSLVILALLEADKYLNPITSCVHFKWGLVMNLTFLGISESIVKFYFTLS